MARLRYPTGGVVRGNEIDGYDVEKMSFIVRLIEADYPDVARDVEAIWNDGIEEGVVHWGRILSVLAAPLQHMVSRS